MSVSIRSRLMLLVLAVLLPGLVGTVMDDRGNVIARHPGGKLNIGRQATPDLRARMARAGEGLFESTSLDGPRTRGCYSTSPRGWTYISAMPLDQYLGISQRSVVQVSLGALGLLALAILGAMLVSRGIVGPVQTLKSAAVRMQAGQGGPIASPGSTGIAEYDEVARAMATASAAITRAREELETRVADAIARTRQAEQHLSQSQRVEALGRLTGGVAHDFNNLLGIISNSAHLIGRHPAAADLATPLGATRRAVQTGHQLTQHLLRFADQRPSTRMPVELGRYLPEATELIRSLLGRRIELVVNLAPGTAPALVDAGGVELALINLALNARDAMPSGGELRLHARNATVEDREDLADVGGGPAGPAVLITVGDDGMVLSQVQRAHDAQHALRQVAAGPAFDVVLTDVVMPGELDGFGLARLLRQQHPDLAVVLISDYSSAAAQSEFTLLSKPCPLDELLAVLSDAVAATALRRAQASGAVDSGLALA